MLLSYLYLNIYFARVSIFYQYLNTKIKSFNLKCIKILRNKWNESIHCHSIWFQKMFIHSSTAVIWFEPHPPPKIQFSFILSLTNLWYQDPWPPWNFHWPSLGWIWILSGTLHHYFEITVLNYVHHLGKNQPTKIVFNKSDFFYDKDDIFSCLFKSWIKI